MNCIVITGSSRGIGYGLALEFLKRGNNVIINGTSELSVNKALEKLNRYKKNVAGLVGDVKEKYFAVDLYNFACKMFHTVEIWINNAGINQPLCKAWDIPAEDISLLLAVNVEAVIRNTTQIYKEMEKQGYGKIFNMEGLGSNGQMIDKTALYGTSKRALSYFTKAFAKESEHRSIIVGIISPGMVITDFITEPIKLQTPDEAKKTIKVFNMLGSRVEEITPYLVSGMIRTQKHYPRIEYLTTWRVVQKILNHLIKPRNYFENTLN